MSNKVTEGQKIMLELKEKDKFYNCFLEVFATFFWGLFINSGNTLEGLSYSKPLFVIFVIQQIKLERRHNLLFSYP